MTEATRNRRLPSCWWLLLSIPILLVSAIFLYRYLVIEMLSHHHIADYSIEAGSNEVSIPFAGSQRHFYIEFITPDSFKNQQDVIEAYEDTTITLSVVRNQQVVYTDESTTSNYGFAPPQRRPYRKNASLKVNFPHELVKVGIDSLHIRLNENQTSVPRPLTLKLYYRH